jgi:hypothetical protein
MITVIIIKNYLIPIITEQALISYSQHYCSRQRYLEPAGQANQSFKV